MGRAYFNIARDFVFIDAMAKKMEAFETKLIEMTCLLCPKPIHTIFSKRKSQNTNPPQKGLLPLDQLTAIDLIAREGKAAVPSRCRPPNPPSFH